MINVWIHTFDANLLLFVKHGSTTFYAFVSSLNPCRPSKGQTTTETQGTASDASPGDLVRLAIDHDTAMRARENPGMQGIEQVSILRLMTSRKLELFTCHW